MLDPDCTTPPVKTCSKCGFTGSVDQFRPHSRTCHKCRTAYQRAYHAAHRAELNARSQAYRLANIERISEWQALFRESHRAERRAASRDWYARTSEARRAQKRAYRAANPDECRRLVRVYHRAHRAEMNAYRKAWDARNRERRAAYQRKWDEAHPEQLREINRRSGAVRRARQAGAPEVEHIDRATLWARDGGRCHLCGKKCDPANWHADHLVPLSKGGSHTMANLAVAHPACNLRRHNTGPAQLRLME